MKVSKLLLVIALTLVSVAMLVACGGFDTDTDGQVYTIIFDVNNGDGEDILILTNGRQPIVMPPDPVRNGYDFLGWYFDVEGRVKLTSNYFVTNPISSNKRVYALWRTKISGGNGNENPGGPIEEKPTYSITFHSAQDTPKTITSHSPLNAGINVTNPEHNFVGWYLDSDYEGSPVVFPLTLTEDIHLYAKWEIKKYSITFLPGDSATGTSPVIADKALNETFTLPQNPYTRPNHVFIGWHDGFNLLNAGTEYTVITRANHTFTARWERTYVPSFFPGDGTGAAFSLPAMRFGTMFAMPESPFTRPGYVFLHWKAEGSNETFAAGENMLMPAREQRFDAVWIEAYSLIFDGGDGVTGTAPLIAPQPAGARVTLPQNTFAKEGYEFVCWEDSAYNRYDAGTQFIMPARSVAFKAIWRETVTYPVSFLAGQGGTGEAPPVMAVQPGTVINLPANTFERIYYKFDGWEYNGNLYAPDASFTVPSAPVSFEASWSPVSYSIRYHVIEGYVSSNPSMYNVETPTFTLVNPQVEGYAFEGWYSDQGFQYPVETTTIMQGSAGDLEFYAKLSPLIYKIYFNNLQGGTLNGTEPGGYIEVRYGRDYSEALSRVGATRPGYLLAFWAYEGRNYIPSAVWNRASDLTLSAVWTEIGTQGLVFAINDDQQSYSVMRYNGQDTGVTVPSYYNKMPVTRIGNAAFNRSNVTSVFLPETLLTIGDQAFKESALKKITLPRSLQSIGSYAFADTDFLETVSVKEGSALNVIGSYAFSNSSSLGYIRLPEALYSVGQSAFAGSPSLSIFSSAINISGGFANGWNAQNAPVYWGLVKSGDFYFAASGEGLALVEYVGNAAYPAVPESVNGVPVVAVGGYAFRGNAGIKGIILPSGVTNIAEGAFARMDILEYVYIPAGVTQMELYDFLGSDAVVVYSAGNLAVNGNVPVNTGVSEIMFEGNWYYVAVGGGMVKITKYAGTEATVTVPESLGGYAVCSVGDGAFRNARSLTSVTIPASIAQMGYNVFDGTLLTINALTQKPVAWAPGWASARPVNWGYTVITSDPEYDYVEYDGKAYIVAEKGSAADAVIPQSINGLPVAGVYGAFVFRQNLRSVFIPATVTELTGTFIDCPNLIIYTDAPAPNAGWVNWNPGGYPVYYSSDIQIANGMYKVTVSGAIAQITGYTLIPAGGALIFPAEVATDTGSYTVSGIGPKAYFGAGLNLVTIPFGYYVGANAFGGNPSLVIFYEGSEADAAAFGDNWNGGAPVYYGIDAPMYQGNFEFIIRDGNAVLTGYTGSESEVYVPYKLGGSIVREIGSRAFGRQTYTAVYLPATVYEIHNDSFINTSWNYYYGAQGTSGEYGYFVFESDVYISSYLGSDKIITVPAVLSGAGNVKGLVRAFAGKNVTAVIAPAGINFVSEAFYNSPSYPSILFAGSESNIIINNMSNAAVFYNAGSVMTDAGFTYIIADGKAVILGSAPASDITVPAALGGAPAGAIADGVFAAIGDLRTVRIPASVTYIANGAFAGRHGAKVYLERDLAAGENEWYTGITLVAGKEIFNENGFEYYIENHEATVVGYIGAASIIAVPAAFGGYPVTRINGNAFYGMPAVAEITIPASVRYIGRDAFAECGNMVIRSEALAAHPDWQVDWNCGLEVIFAAGSYKQNADFRFIAYDGTAYLLEYIGSGSTLVLDEFISDLEGNTYWVADIGRIFAGNTTIKSLVVPDHIVDFFPVVSGMTALEEIYIPAAVTEIPDEAFAGYRKLRTVTFSGSSALTRIGYRAFYDCVLLENILIPSLVTQIGDEAFMNCASLTKITLSDLVTELGKSVFENCRNLSEVYANAVQYIGEKAFKNAPALGVFAASDMRYIAESAFENAKGLHRLQNTDNLEYIGARAFMGAASLGQVNIASVTYIGDEAFKGATALRVDGGIINAAYIGASAFEGAVSLSLAAGFGSGVEYIGARAFYNSGYFGELAVSRFLTYIGPEAFAGAGIEAFAVAAQNPMYKSLDGVLYNKGATALIQYPALSPVSEFEVPLSVTGIAASAFRGAAALNTLILHDGVRSIGARALENCVSLTVYSALPAAPAGFDPDFNSSNRPVYWSNATYGGTYDNMVYIVENGEITITGYNGTADSAHIPSAINDIPVTAIGAYAFSYSGVKWVYIPATVTEVGTYAFAGGTAAVYCEAVSAPTGFVAGWNLSFDSKGATITLPVYFGSTVSTENGFQYVVNNGNAVITKYTGVASSVRLPATLGGFGVTEISRYAFSGTRLKSVFVPSLIEKISATAFKGNGYIVIYTDAASAKQGWESGFNNLCPVYYGIGLISAENGYEYIVKDGYAAITRFISTDLSVNIPAALGGLTVREIGSYAFAGAGLTYVNIPATVRVIGNNAFADCRQLDDVEFEEGAELLTIGSYAFRNNLSLTFFYIPSTVTMVMYSAFNGCTALEAVYFDGPSAVLSGWEQGWNYLYGEYVYVRLDTK